MLNISSSVSDLIPKLSVRASMQLQFCLIFSKPRKYAVLFSPCSTHLALDLIWYPLAFSLYSISNSPFTHFLWYCKVISSDLPNKLSMLSSLL